MWDGGLKPVNVHKLGPGTGFWTANPPLHCLNAACKDDYLLTAIMLTL